jgi:CheY-like chemotaxis protein
VHDEAAGAADPGPERPLDILVVDDDADTIALAVATLGDRGHAVLAAGGAAQALRLAEHTAFDVVVCGLGAGSGGTELVHRLRQLPTSRRARYVVAGESLDGSVSLAKPFDAGALRRAVEGAGER